MTERKIVCVSGYFDPLHIGHIEYFKRAKALGTELFIIVNNDDQSKLKKGRSFMKCNERMAIIAELKSVDRVIESVDTDRTVCVTLEQLRMEVPNEHFIFANGGDQTNDTIPERDVCQRCNITLVDGLGIKVQSSSWLTGLTTNKQ